MSSDSTKALLQTAFDRLTTYVDKTGTHLSDLIGANFSTRLYFRITPDTVQYPYVVLRCIAEEPDIEFANFRSRFTIEARCVHRSEDGTVESIADFIEAALLTWQESSSVLGYTRGQSSRRESQEPLADAANRDLAEVTVFVTCVSWATRLTGIVA